MSDVPSLGSRIIPVILSGGTGTRLWPISRESFPKQFWPLASERTMIQETALRARGDAFDAPIVVCNHAHRFLVAQQLRDAGIEDGKIVLEPVGRNSAPAILAAAFIAAETNPGAVLWVLAADHAVQDPAALQAALQVAATAALDRRIVTFGMRPQAPETGYGYIRVGAQMPGIPGAYEVSAFMEKPSAAIAASFLTAGDYLWNSGMFVFTAATLIAEMERYAPDVVAAVREAIANRIEELDFIHLEATAFRRCPSISVDYAVAERTDRAAVVPALVGWTDVGSWSALWDLGEKDGAGNVAHGNIMLEDAVDCYVRSDGILSAVVGLKDVVLVTTNDAVLAVHRDRAQDVKRIVDRLRADGRPQATAHKRAYRPWGYYESLIQEDRFQVKRIVVQPGEKLSLQTHHHRAEHWVVVGGTALVTRDAEAKTVCENESIYLPQGCVHRVENAGLIPLTLIEVQCGSYLGEDDIVRLEDTYGRI